MLLPKKVINGSKLQEENSFMENLGAILKIQDLRTKPSKAKLLKSRTELHKIQILESN